MSSLFLFWPIYQRGKEGRRETVNISFAIPCNDTCQANSTLAFNSIHKFENISAIRQIWGPNSTYVHYIDKGTDMKEYARHSVTTYLVNGALCYAVDFARDFTTDYTFLDARASKTSLMIQFFVFAEACRDYANCHLFVTHRGNLHVNSVVGKPLVLGSHFVLSYQKQELNLLPPPYTTKCYDYLKHGIRSQRECFSKFERIYASRKGWALEGFVPVTEEEDILRDFWPGEPSQWSRSHCSKTSCQLEQYYVQDSIKPRDNPNKTLISLMFPENGELIVNYKPQFSLWEFLTLFGSVFSLWLGLNGLAFSMSVLDGIMWLKFKIF